MKFGRKSRTTGPETGTDEVEGAEVEQVEAAEPAPAPGPRDIADVDVETDGVDRVDLGGLLIAPAPGFELRLQVDEATQSVQSVLVAGPEGGLELRAFAAARNEDMWPEIRRQIAADVAQRGGTADEREGTWGTELTCRVQVTTTDGRVGRQESRVVGVNGPRWFVRATFVGKPAAAPDEAADYEAILDSLVVRRGAGAMAPGDPLPLTLPAQARRVQA